MAHPALTPWFAIEDTWKRFGSRPVLRSASVWAYPGAVTVLFGRNGEGKSTLLRCGLGLVRSDIGLTILGGRRYCPPTLWRLAREGLFFLPDRDLLPPALPIRRLLDALTARFPEAQPDRVGAVLGDATLVEGRPRDLSGGERRLADLGYARARAPTVLVADEPLRGLAPLTAQRVSGHLRSMAAEGSAVLVTGHEARDLLTIADHVVWMTGGTTHHLGTRNDALAHALFREQYLSSPHF